MGICCPWYKIQREDGHSTALCSNPSYRTLVFVQINFYSLMKMRKLNGFEAGICFFIFRVILLSCLLLVEYVKSGAADIEHVHLHATT